MKFGATPWKIVILSVLGLGLVWALYSAFSGDRPATTARATAPATVATRAAAPDPILDAPAQEVRSRPGLRPEARTMRLTLKDKKADPTTVDPTIRFDLLAKLRDVTLQGGDRNLFQFGAAPLPPRPEPKIAVKMPASQAQQVQADAGPPPPPPPPQAPPVPFKFYGYSNALRGAKKAFFLQGEDIVVAAEGELIQKRYKVVRIGVNSCIVEDTQFKHQQTLQLEEQAG